MQNLDLIAAQIAPEILDNITDAKQRERKETLINQALGILAEQGPFAMMLWARTQSGNGKIGNALKNQLSGMLEATGLANCGNGNFNTWLANFNTYVCGDFVTLMMTRQLFERVLIYARHYAKAE